MKKYLIAGAALTLLFGISYAAQAQTTEPNFSSSVQVVKGTPNTPPQPDSPGYTIYTHVTNNGGPVTNAIVDVEIKSQSGQKIQQWYFEGQDFAAGETKSNTQYWIPEQPGTYIVAVGVFAEHWSKVYTWNDPAATITSEGEIVQPSDASRCGRPGTNNFNVCYYDNKDFTNFKLNRTDEVINFDWGNGSPHSLVGSDTFSARWAGLFEFEEGDYEFTVTTDDGFRLNVASEVILDKMFDQGPTTYTMVKRMTAGQRGVIAEYYENSGGAVAKVSWKKVTDATPIPPYSPENVRFCGRTGANGFNACYFDNKDFTEFRLLRHDNEINFDWGAGSPDPLINPDSFSAQWDSTIPFENGEYEFTITTDDGMRVSIDSEVVFDKWFDQAATTYTFKKTMTAGEKRLHVRYFETGGEAVAKVSWRKLSDSTTPPPTQGDVTLNSSALGSAHYDSCPLLTAMIQNSSSQSRNVLIDIELRNSNGTLIDQYFVDNYSVPSSQNGSMSSITNQCSRKLPEGTYHYSVGIFNTGWTSLVHWYNNVKTFTVDL